MIHDILFQAHRNGCQVPEFAWAERPLEEELGDVADLDHVGMQLPREHGGGPLDPLGQDTKRVGHVVEEEAAAVEGKTEKMPPNSPI